MIASNAGFVVYPTGYATTSSEHTGVSVRTEGDREVAELFTNYRLGKISLTDYEVFKKAVDLATRLMGTGTNWIEIQRRNPNLDRMKAEFIEDTLNYLVSGKRRMHVRTWLSVTDDRLEGKVSPIVMNGPIVHDGIRVPVPHWTVVPSSIVAAWLSHNDGLGDLIETLNILFGGVPY